MQRASRPTELILGFFAGLIAAFCVQMPLVSVLHQLGLTNQYGFSMNRVLPMGVMAFWSRAFWGGAYGVVLAWLGCYRPFGTRYIRDTVLAVTITRIFIDYVPASMFYGQPWVGWNVGRMLTPVIANLAWAGATSLLLIAFSLWAGTFGNRSVI
jgi:hypothetical protein